MVKIPDEFRPALPCFRGPLDLLLYLIKKDEIDILDIPIAQILDQYIEYLRLLQDIDVNLAGEFLVMASTLMEIKSKTLLPEPPALDEEDLDLDDPRLDLVRQLLEYKKYKERAVDLQQRFEEMRRRYARPRFVFEPGEGEEPELDLGDVSVWDLLTAFIKIQKAIGARLPQRIVYEERPIEHYIDRIRGELGAAADPVPFERLFASAQDRFDVIGFFLAILEMARCGQLDVRQEGPFAEITLALRDAPLDVPDIPEISEAAAEPGAPALDAPAPAETAAVEETL